MSYILEPFSANSMVSDVLEPYKVKIEVSYILELFNASAMVSDALRPYFIT